MFIAQKQRVLEARRTRDVAGYHLSRAAAKMVLPLAAKTWPVALSLLVLDDLIE